VKLHAVAHGPRRQSTSVMLGHACETLAVMCCSAFSKGPHLLEIKPQCIDTVTVTVTVRTHSMHTFCEDPNYEK
jgi:hypothetical protein